MHNAVYFTKTNIYIYFKSLKITILTFYIVIRPTNNLYIFLTFI